MYRLLLTPIGLLLLFSLKLPGQIHGLVYRDFNFNGIRDSVSGFVESGEAGFLIRITDRFGNTQSTRTDSKGYYHFMPAVSSPYRLEFVVEKEMDFPAPIVSEGGGAPVRFVYNDHEKINFGINYPEDYCRNAEILTPCYVIGDPLNSTSEFRNLEALVKWSSENGGSSFNQIVPSMQGGSAGNLTKLATGEQIGSCWGIAYQRQSNVIITSASLKRHSGIGPLGYGGLYFLDGSTKNLLASLDLNLIGVPSGAFPDNAGRGLPQTFPPVSADSLAFSSAGKIAYGGLELSEDGKTLYIISLHTRKLYSIFIDNPFRIPGAADVDSFALPDPGCSRGEFRPWALRQRRGKLYIGALCDGSLGGSQSDLTAFVYEFDPKTKNYKTVLEFVFDYNIVPSNPRYFPWVDKWDSQWPQAPAEFFQKPQPVLTDIEFDGDDHMVLGISDRMSMQAGVNQKNPDGKGTYSVLSLGDILRAGRDSVTGLYVLENNARVGTIQTDGRNGGFGPGGGEYYYGDNAINTSGVSIEPESTSGGLAICPGQGNIITTAVDVFDFFTNGVIHLNNQTGAGSKRYQVIPADFTLFIGKSNALGDLRLKSDPASIEIGDYVWKDLNNNGIQDPIEPPLSNVTLELVKDGILLATARTNEKGRYLFSNAPAPPTIEYPESFIYGIPGLTENEDYQIRIPNIPTQTALNNLSTSPAPSGNPGIAEIDNNGIINGNDVLAEAKTKMHGNNDHSYDFGFHSNSGGGVFDPVISAGPCNGLMGDFELNISLEVVNGPVGDLMAVFSTGEIRRIPGSPDGIISYTLKNIEARGIKGVDVKIYFLNDTTLKADIQDAFDQPDPCCSNDYNLCENRENLIELEAPTGYARYCWFIASTGEIIGKLRTLTVLKNSMGLEDGSERYYFIAIDDKGDTTFQYCPFNIQLIQCCALEVTNFLPTECNNNGTIYNPDDDWFAVLVNAQNPDAGFTNRYEVYHNGVLLGSAPYGSPILVGTSSNPPFKADGISRYKIVIRDVDDPNCIDSVFTTVEKCPAPKISVKKSLFSNQIQSDASHNVVYRIEVKNEGNEAGNYNLTDEPDFDDDISILSSFFTTNIPGKAGAALTGSGPWTLLTNQTINPGSTHVVTLTMNLKVDLSPSSSGNNLYTKCGTANDGIPSRKEGLFNLALLDVGSDGSVDARDTSCTDLPYVTIEKEFLGSVQTGFKSHSLDYRLIVRNRGGIGSSYNLLDRPAFDDDITIQSAEFTTNFNSASSLSSNVPLNGWLLTSARMIQPFVDDTFLLKIKVQLDLDPGSLGNNIYRSCGTTNPSVPRTGEGLFNVALLDLNNDLRAERRDTTCNDLAQLIHEKKLLSESYNSDGSLMIQYRITLRNEGGKAIAYTLVDKPAFDDDVLIQSAQFSMNGGSPAPITTLPPAAGWILAQNRILSGLGRDSFDINLHLKIDLSENSTGNKIFEDCRQDVLSQYLAGFGLFNESQLDYTGDQIPDQRDTVCSAFDYYDLALKKTNVNINPVKKGDKVAFRITVYNQGNQTARNIKVTDYLPKGYIFYGALNPQWVAQNDSILEYLIAEIPAKDSANFDLILKATGFLQDARYNLNHAEISSFQGNDLLIHPDIDSWPDQIRTNDNSVQAGSINDNNIAGRRKFRPDDDEDDQDVAVVPFLDLALRKRLTTPAPYRYGQKHHFQITVYNQGNVPTSKVDIVDYIPQGYLFESTDNPEWSIDGNKARLFYIGVIMPGDSMNFEIILNFLPTDHPRKWINEAEIQQSYIRYFHLIYFIQEDLDSKPDDLQGNDPGGVVLSESDDHIFDDAEDSDGDGILDEDDHDPAVPFVWDLALTKWLATPAPHYPDQILEFRITLHNQGTDTVGKVSLVDYPTLAYSFDQTLNPDWSVNGKNLQTTLQRRINPGDSASVRLFLKLKPGRRPADDYINYAEITASENIRGEIRTGFDLDSQEGTDTQEERSVLPGTQDDNRLSRTGENGIEDDHDPAAPEIVDLALRKTLVTPGPVHYGDTLRFKICLINQGYTPISQVEVVDYLPNGLNWVQNPGWIFQPTPRTAVQNWSGNLLPGDSITLFIDLKVHENFSGGREMTNRAEICSLKDYAGRNYTRDIDSKFDKDPNNDKGGIAGTVTDDHVDDDGVDSDLNGICDEDDSDPLFVPVVDFALRKELVNPNAGQGGDTAVYKITVLNQGNVSSSSLMIVDYINSGYSFPVAQIPGWAYNAQGNMVYTFNKRISPGSADSILVRLLIKPGTSLESLYNYAEIYKVVDTLGKDISGYDADSKPKSNSDYERSVIPGHNWDDLVNGGGSKYMQDEDDHDVAGISARAKLGDMVWHDRNGNGIMENGEEGIRNVMVQLYAESTKILVKATLTDDKGKYLFDNIAPGKYYVRFVPPSGWTITDPGKGTLETDSDVTGEYGTGTTPCIRLNPNDDNRTIDLGLYKCAPISGLIFYDLNRNGVHETSESGINGLRVFLHESATGKLIAQSTTHSNNDLVFHDGFYQICARPGNYYIRLQSLSGFISTLFRQGSNPVLDSDLSDQFGPFTSVPFSVQSCDTLRHLGGGIYNPSYQKSERAGETMWIPESEDDLETKISQKETEQSWILYPNPADGMIYVLPPCELASQIRIEILDINGRLVKNIQTAENSTLPLEVSLTDLPPGAYLCRVSCASEIRVKPFLIAR